MAKRTRPKSKRQPSRRVRSLRAVKGWKTRRRNNKRREQSARKLLKSNKRAGRIMRESERARERGHGRIEEPPLRDFVISVSYRKRGGGTRVVDFVASARTREEALQQMFKAQPWTEKIPWQKVSIHAGPIVKKSHELLHRLETKSSSSRKRKKSR